MGGESPDSSVWAGMAWIDVITSWRSPYGFYMGTLAETFRQRTLLRCDNSESGGGGRDKAGHEPKETAPATDGAPGDNLDAVVATENRGALRTIIYCGVDRIVTTLTGRLNEETPFRS